MDENSLSALDEHLKKNIIIERENRKSKKDNLFEIIPPDLRFLASCKQYHIKEIMTLCTGDYRELVTVLLMKRKIDSVIGYSIINIFRAKPLVFICLLSIHPQAKAKLVGKSKFIIVKFLTKHPRLLELAKTIYRKINR
ncbi:hypothetical protein ABQG65_01230 [Yersinia alsatica]|uniref:hypothetical protein n=1 Tax=Yersinia alsatica TaxID=2890317 RepID=UPI0032EAADFB